MTQKTKLRGVFEEAASQGKGALVGAAAVAVAVPFFGWAIGATLGLAALGGSVLHSLSRKPGKKP